MIEAVHTLEEAAEILRLPYRTVRDAVFRGHWPHVKVSQRKRLMTDANIEEVLRMLHQEAKPQVSESSQRQTRANIRRMIS